MPRRRRDPLVALANAEIALRLDVEALDRAVRGREEAGVQILAAETVAERARAIVRAATDVGRTAARQAACADVARPLPANVVGDLRVRARQRIRDELRGGTT